MTAIAARRSTAGRLRDLLRGDRPLRGIFIKLGEVDVVEIAAVTQDFVVLDLEHSAMGEEAACRCLRHAAAIGLPALVRIAGVDPGQVNRLLEAGAAGLQLSTVATGAQVEALRDATRHHPEGRRSISLGHAGAGFGRVTLGDHLAAQAADPPVLVVQLETDLADPAVRAILDAAPDVAFIGTTDLLVSLELSREALRDRVERYVRAIGDSGVALGGFALEDRRVVYDTHATDLQLLVGALARSVPERVG